MNQHQNYETYYNRSIITVWSGLVGLHRIIKAFDDLFIRSQLKTWLSTSPLPMFVSTTTSSPQYRQQFDKAKILVFPNSEPSGAGSNIMSSRLTSAKPAKRNASIIQTDFTEPSGIMANGRVVNFFFTKQTSVRRLLLRPQIMSTYWAGLIQIPTSFPRPLQFRRSTSSARKLNILNIRLKSER